MPTRINVLEQIVRSPPINYQVQLINPRRNPEGKALDNLGRTIVSRPHQRSERNTLVTSSGDTFASPLLLEKGSDQSPVPSSSFTLPLSPLMGSRRSRAPLFSRLLPFLLFIVLLQRSLTYPIIDPSRSKLLSWKPRSVLKPFLADLFSCVSWVFSLDRLWSLGKCGGRAFVYERFLTDEECDHLISLVSTIRYCESPLDVFSCHVSFLLFSICYGVWSGAEIWRDAVRQARSELKRSAVADNLSGKSTLSEVRTSSGMFISKGKVWNLVLSVSFT